MRLPTLIALVTVANVAAAQSSPRPSPVEIRCPRPPIAVVTEGKTILAYELHVTNFGARSLKLNELRIGTGAGTGVLATYRDSALRALIQPVGVPEALDSTRLGVGRRLIIFVWLEADGHVSASTLRHRLAFSVIDTSTSASTNVTESAIDSIFVPISTARVPVLHAPVRSGQWFGGNGPSNFSDHRRSVFSLEGDVFIAQRFATDWNMIGANGNTWHDDRKRNENFWGFGQDVLAPADGEVVAVLDSIGDNVPGALPAISLATIAGNYVTVRIAPDRYVLFAHLKRGSVRVHTHQRVRAGDVLASLGNTGQSTAPHLHMQLMDRNSVLAAEGVPFLFDHFAFLGYGRDFEASKHPFVPRRLGMTMDDMVVEFTRP